MIHTIAPNKPTPGPDYLQPTSFLDCDHPAVREFSRSVTEGALPDQIRATAILQGGSRNFGAGGSSTVGDHH